jgi:putative copper resistance protein D
MRRILFRFCCRRSGPRAVRCRRRPRHGPPQGRGHHARHGTDAANVTQISVTFSEPLVPAMSGMDVVMTGMPGMDHHDPMKMTGVKSTVSADKLTLVAKLPRALPAGTYEALARGFDRHASRGRQAHLHRQVMTDRALVWLRWPNMPSGAGFGAFAAWLMGHGRMSAPWRWVLALSSMLACALACGVFTLTLARMMGGSLGDVDRDTAHMMLADSALGWSVMARCGLMVVVLALALWRGAGRLGDTLLPAALASASLAWGGHGAASAGELGWVRLAGDVVHIWAGIMWLGALMLFAAGLWRAGVDDRAALNRMARMLGSFALVGTVLVGALVVTGLANLLFLGGPGEWRAMAATPYGQAMLAKLAMFGGMFLLAAHNRFHLVPALEDAHGGHTRRKALNALRRSVTLELLLALGVVGAVALAGTMDPMGRPRTPPQSFRSAPCAPRAHVGPAPAQGPPGGADQTHRAPHPPHPRQSGFAASPSRPALRADRPRCAPHACFWRRRRGGCRAR